MTKYNHLLIVFVFSLFSCSSTGVTFITPVCRRFDCNFRTTINTKLIKKTKNTCNETEDINYEKRLLNNLNQELKKELNTNFAKDIGLDCEQEYRIHASFEISENGILENIYVRAPVLEIKNKTIQTLKRISGIKKPCIKNEMHKNSKFHIKIMYESHFLNRYEITKDH